MRRKFIIYIVTIIFIIGTFCGCGKSSKKKGDDYKEVSNKINKYIDTLVKDKKFSGDVLVAKKSDIITKKAVGYSNYELNARNTADTKFRIGNMTNEFTAVSILQLEDKGLLNIDDPVLKYIPNYPKGDIITLRQLLNHTSGIPNYVDFEEYNNIARIDYPLSKIIDSFKYRPLEFTPGSKFKYSDSNYILLGYIIEKVSGKKYSEYIDENILKPNKMLNTGIIQNGVIINNRASGYEYNDSGNLLNVKYEDPSRWYSASGMYSTIGDLYLWDKALYGEQVLSSKEKTKFFTPDEGKNYIFGWTIDSTAGHKFFQQNSKVSGFSGSISRYIKDDVVIIILSNNSMTTEDIDKISSNIAVYLFQ